eukprot:g2810.t1
MAATQTKNVITLKGSVDIVTEFFGYSINSILFQRGIYPPETFSRMKKYGLAMLVTQDENLKKYLSNVLSQLQSWLMEGKVQKLVLVIEGTESKKTLERWQFNIEQDRSVTVESKGKEKSKKEITKEIQAIIRQITASVTFLPLLEEPCTFDLLVYAYNDAAVPGTWEESDAKTIDNQTEVKLRSFSTKVHKVDAMVAYRTEPDDDEDI